MRFEQRFHVDAGRERAFAYLADITNEARWNPWAKEVTRLDDGPIGEGAKFSGRYKGMGRVEQWLEDYRPPSHVEYRSTTMDGRMIFDLQPSESGTVVTLTAEAHPSGARRLAMPVMRRMMSRHIGGVAAGIKRELDDVTGL